MFAEKNIETHFVMGYNNAVYIFERKRRLGSCV